MKTQTDPETFEKLRRITDLMRNNTRQTVAIQREPATKIDDIKSSFKEKQPEITTRHQAARKKLEDEMKELKLSQDSEWSDFHKRREAALEPYYMVMRESNAAHDRTNEELKADAKKLLKEITLVDAIALIPEDIRPVLIPVGPDGNMYLMQIKMAPHLAFAIRAREGGTTKFTVTVNSLISTHQHHLVCFCAGGGGCMTSGEYSWAISALVEKCKEHSITHVFGRKVGEVRDGITFSEGYGYQSLIEKVVTNADTLRYMHYYVSLHE